jgi:hypothetical protein
MHGRSLEASTPPETVTRCSEGTAAPSWEQDYRETPKNADELRLEEYARQESNNPVGSAEYSSGLPITDAQSDALSHNSPSSVVTLLSKLVGGLAVDERALLARLLERTEGG